MNLKSILTNEKVVKGLSVTGKVAKAVVIEGIKGVLLKSATKAITTSFDSGIESVKNLTLDEYLGKKKKKIVDVSNVVRSEKDRVVVDAEYEPVEKSEVH